MKGVKKIFKALVLAVTILAAGQTAWATTKAVTYTITSVESINLNYDVVFTRTGDTPFNTSVPSTYTASVPASYFAKTSGGAGSFSVELADGFMLNLNWGADSDVWFVDNCIIPRASGKYITYTVSCPDNYYYTTHVMMTGTESNFQLGMPQTYPNSGSIDTDYNSVWNFSEKYYSSYSFGQITISYSDAPSLSIFESDGENTYKIKSKEDLRHLANYVNKGHNDCSGLTFHQMQDITCDASYVPIGNSSYGFKGTYDGQGNTVSGITVTRTGMTDADRDIGLFGNVLHSSDTVHGTVKNVILTNSTFTGFYYIGGIVGNCTGTVQNCRVENTVTINSGTNAAASFGGIVGRLQGSRSNVIGCISAAALSRNGFSVASAFGGIVGNLNDEGTIKNCLYTGSSIDSNNPKGAVLGSMGTGTLTNNYYTDIDLGGVNGSDADGARRAHTVTLGENVVLVGDETVYDVSGLTAIGTGNYALRYADGTTTKIYSGEGQTLTLAYTGNVPTGGSVVYTVTNNSDGSDITADVLSGSTLTIPAANVTISATIAATPVATTYIDADGNSREVTALPLLGTETELGNTSQETWYVVNSDVSYDHQVTLYGDVHLILADGKTMTMTVSVDNNSCIDYGLSNNLTIYGQSGDTGTLNANSKKSRAIGGSGTLTVNGGRITAIAKNRALGGSNGITINGGVINATSQFQNGIESSYGNITINGGQVNTNGIFTSGSIIFGYRNDTDYITIGDGGCQPNVYIAAGKSMTDGTNIYIASANSNMKIDAELSNVTLRPVIPASVELTLAQGTKDGVIAYWGTFYDNAAGYSLPAGATAYTMDENKNLYRLGTDGSKIPAGVPVVIISKVSAITLTKEDGIVTAADNAPGGNILRGTNGLVELEYDPNDNKYKIDGKIPYVLSVSEGVIGFRKYVGVGSSAPIPAHKAYYLVTP